MKKIISIMLCIMLSVSMMTACGSKESDNDKKDVGSETKQDVFTYDLKGVTVAIDQILQCHRNDQCKYIFIKIFPFDA